MPVLSRKFYGINNYSYAGEEFGSILLSIVRFVLGSF